MADAWLGNLADGTETARQVTAKSENPDEQSNCLLHPRIKPELTIKPRLFNRAISRSLSDLKNRSENSAGRGQILTILQGNSRSIAQKSGEIWTGQADLQPISFKSDRLLGA
jgi:LDH2 family malate/lactate/ureidoglycolate dehydrogenase